jgi:hypothetical protein
MESTPIKMYGLLNVGCDYKTRKGEKLGYLTGILYLAPSDTSGFANTCPFASEGCKLACLFTAGRGIMSNVMSARIEKTRRFKQDTEQFLLELSDNIRRIEARARKEQLIPAVRLNGTSDIPWENVKLDGRNMMSIFPNVKFYDYTKNPDRMRKFLTGQFPTNYHLTFSRSETNDTQAIEFLRYGANVAMVFMVKKGMPLPNTRHGFPIIDGDETDVRLIDGRGKVIGLRAKGKAKKDSTGFVILQ